MTSDRRHGLRRFVQRVWGLLAVLVLLLSAPLPVLAGPVDWEEVPATAEGRQWWDRGSLRVDRQQRLTVLSRYLPPAGDGERPPSGSLYVMELDCGQALYRDLQRNGLPRLQASWEAAASDALVGSVLEASCAEARRQGLLG
jgi:hypothetical protein